MDHAFQGRISRFVQDAEAWWPDDVRAPAGAPNVVLVVLDDVGFAQLGCYGSQIDTPVIDALAAGGLRFSSFHTTALCSPTRATLLTGKNHHRVGMGRVIELATGFPGYDSRIPLSTPMLPELLVPHGYAAWAVGKWHLAPEEDLHLAASRKRWPLARGFERFYGFMDGETHQYAPALVCDNHVIDQPASPEEGYHLTEDLCDQSIRLVRDLRQADADKPFFLYLALGACHSPHQVPAEWIERHRGRFDRGWDVERDETMARQVALGVMPEHTDLSERPDWVPAWDAMSEPSRRMHLRQMEVFAGFLSHADHHLGRVVEALRDTGDLDNTMIVVLSDNGASSEGGPHGSLNDNRLWNLAGSTRDEALDRLDELGGPTLHNNYSWGWTITGNTPFRRWKREVHEGGVADPLVVHWPAGLPDAGAVREHYVHSTDVFTTVLDACGLEAPDDVDGVSFLPSARDAAVPSARTMQFFEMFGCRALWREGFKLVAYHPIQVPEPPISDVEWELYDTRADPAETHDLAGQLPDLRAELVELWWAEAERNQALPLDNRPFSELVEGRPTGLPPRSSYTYWPGTSMVNEAAMVNVRNRSWLLEADTSGSTHGVVLCQGNVLGGWVFFLSRSRLCWTHNFVGMTDHRLVSEPVDLAGDHVLGLRFTRTGKHAGTVELSVDGTVVAEAAYSGLTPNRFSLTGAGQWCGRSGASPVCADDGAAHAIDGVLHRVRVEVEGEPFVDPVLEAAHMIERQ